jgi:hypothetical protein
MNKLTYNYFIKIIIEMINEKQINIIDSGLFLYVYTTIIHDILSIYCLNIKSINSEIIKMKYPWYKLLLFNSKLYDVIIIYSNIELLKLINNDIDSNLINNHLKFGIPELLISNDYYDFNLEYNKKIFEEIKININKMYNEYSIKNILTKIDNYDIYFSDNLIYKILLKIDLIDWVKNYSSDKYNKMNKINEMIEIINLSQNLNYEQKILSNFWICILNRIGIFGFWNYVLSVNINNINNSIMQVDLFYKLNLLFYNGIYIINELKNNNNSISPYDILKVDVLNFNNNSIWFIENNIIIKNISEFEFPSEINLLSTIASKFLSKFIGKQKNIIISVKDLELIYENSKLYPDFIDINSFPILVPDEKMFKNNNDLFSYKNNKPIIINFTEFNDISESLSKTYLYLIQSYLTTNLISKEIGVIIFDQLDKLIDNN